MAPRPKETGPAPTPSQTQQDASSEGIESIELPRLLVAQLAKSALPKDVMCDSDTITALVKGSTVFINHLTETAHETAASRGHKSISGADVLKALEVLNFQDIASNLQGELDVFRQGNKSEKGRGSKAPAEGKTKGKEKESRVQEPPEPEPVQAQGESKEHVSDLDMHDEEDIKVLE